MKKNMTYIAPTIKVRTIEAEDGLLAASGLELSVKTTEITSADDIGAKANNTSDGWDDWGEEE